MARTFRQIIKDPKRTGAELGLVLMEKLRNQIQGDDLVATDKEIASMSKELIPEGKIADLLRSAKQLTFV